MPILRCNVVMPYTTTLPRDVVVNTFHVETLDPPLSAATTCSEYLKRFYNTAGGAGANDRISFHLGTMLTRATNGCTMEWYDLSDPMPRIPVLVHPWTLGAANPTTAFPLEVAICCSFLAAPVTGVPRQSTRGRVYLGPLMGALSTNPPLVPGSTVATIAGAGGRLLSDFDGDSQNGLVIWSRTQNTAYTVVSGFVDNAWDTQRRRQLDATARSTFVPA